MPSLEFASGLLGGYFNKMAEERTRREENALRAAQFLLQTGRVRDPNDLLPFLQPLLDQSGPLGPLRKKPGGGARGGGAGGGEGDPWTILSTLIAPTLQRGPGPAPGPQAGAGPSTFPPPAPAPSARRQPFLMTEPEAFQRQLGQATAARRAEGAIDVETDITKQKAQQQYRQQIVDQFAKQFPDRYAKEPELWAEWAATGDKGVFTQAYRSHPFAAGTTKGSEILGGDPGAIDLLGNPVDPEKAYKVRPIGPIGSGEHEYLPVQPTGARQDYVGEMRQLRDAFKTVRENTDPDAVQAAQAVIRKAKESESTAIARLAGLFLTNQQKQQTLSGKDMSNAGKVLDETFVGPFPIEAIADTPRVEFEGRSPRAIYADALALYLRGREPSLGWTTQLPRAAIENVRSRIEKATNMDSSTAQALYTADARALTQLTNRSVLVEQSSDLFERNLRLAEAASTRAPRTMSRLVNKAWIKAAIELTPAVGLSEFETYVYTVAREYGRVVTQQTTGAALTDAATRAAERLLSASMSPETFMAVARALRLEIGNAQASFRVGRDKTRDEMLGLAPKSPDAAAPAQAPGAAPGTTPPAAPPAQAPGGVGPLGLDLPRRRPG